MGLLDDTLTTLGRARYGLAQGMRTAWYGGQYVLARRRSGGFTRPGEPPFRPSRGKADIAAMRAAWFALFQQDRANIEAGLYPPPNDLSLGKLPRALAAARDFLADVPEVDARRMARDGTEVRRAGEADPSRYPAYYRQNFHYQSGGWLSDDSARRYDHQVETLFTGAADAMRRAVLAELARQMRGRDQRKVHYMDLACGTGRFLSQVMRTFPRLQASGLDLSPNYTALARKQLAPWPHVDILEGAGEALPLESGSLDLVTCIYLFHELPPKVRPQVIGEVARVLKPGGVFLVGDSLQFGDNPALDAILEYFPEGFHEPYFRNYLDWDISADMAGAGFEPVSVELAFLTKVTGWRLVRA